MSLLEKLQNSRNALGWAFMLPAAVLLIGLLAYPLGLGTWLGFTDAKIGRPGEWVGLENFKYLVGDSVTQLALFNTLFYTVVASILKFALGLWLALLLNKNLPFKSFFRAVVLLPWIVPTALSAIAFWWLYDAQFSVFSWVFTKLGWIDRYIDFLGDPWNARLSTIAANVWRGVPFVAISLLAESLLPPLPLAATSTALSLTIASTAAFTSRFAVRLAEASGGGSAQNTRPVRFFVFPWSVTVSALTR